MIRICNKFIPNATECTTIGNLSFPEQIIGKGTEIVSRRPSCVVVMDEEVSG